MKKKSSANSILGLMDYTNKDIEKIVQFKTWTDKKKMDELLRIDAAMSCVGTDSTKSEDKRKRKSQEIYKAIRKIHKPTGDLFLMDVDRR